jgi:hypothetical protein
VGVGCQVSGVRYRGLMLHTVYCVRNKAQSETRHPAPQPDAVAKWEGDRLQPGPTGVRFPSASPRSATNTQHLSPGTRHPQSMAHSSRRPRTSESQSEDRGFESPMRYHSSSRLFITAHSSSGSGRRIFTPETGGSNPSCATLFDKNEPHAMDG